MVEAAPSTFTGHQVSLAVIPIRAVSRFAEYTLP